MGIGFSFIMGLAFGIEHFEGDEDEPYHFCIAVSLGIIRVMFLHEKDE